MPGMKNTMHEYKAGKLHSGSKTGPVVKSRKQAIAIGLSEQRSAMGQKNHEYQYKRDHEGHAHLNPDGSVKVKHHDVSCPPNY